MRLGRVRTAAPRRSIPLWVLVLLAAVGCGSLKAPEDCPFGSGAADPAAFARVFSAVSVSSHADAVLQPGPEAEYAFTEGASVEMKATALAPARAQLCLGERKGGGKIAMLRSFDVHEGEVGIPIGRLPKGPYVARVAIDGVIVRNVTFEIR